MTTIRNNPAYARRNDPCPCGSGFKYKKCCSLSAARGGSAPGTRGVNYIDSGEPAVRWVICNDRGTSFFSDEYDKILVFADKAAAFAVAHLEEFASQEPNEINVAGIGETKFTHLRETLPFIEVTDAEHAVRLVRARIAAKTAAPVPPETPTTEETPDENK